MSKEIDKLKEFQAMFLSRLCDKHQEELSEWIKMSKDGT
mgnify:CR=1 FL=1|tara:strand:- start:5156 stop:5272 length:117 start_codon:yes stop_codon:yes gene_type:complete